MAFKTRPIPRTSPPHQAAPPDTAKGRGLQSAARRSPVISSHPRLNGRGHATPSSNSPSTCCRPSRTQPHPSRIVWRKPPHQTATPPPNTSGLRKSSHPRGPDVVGAQDSANSTIPFAELSGGFGSAKPHRVRSPFEMKVGRMVLNQPELATKRCRQWNHQRSAPLGLTASIQAPGSWRTKNLPPLTNSHPQSHPRPFSVSSPPHSKCG